MGGREGGREEGWDGGREEGWEGGREGGREGVRDERKEGWEGRIKYLYLQKRQGWSLPLVVAWEENCPPLVMVSGTALVEGGGGGRGNNGKEGQTGREQRPEKMSRRLVILRRSLAASSSPWICSREM